MVAERMRRNLELSEKAKTIQYGCAPAFLEFRCAFSESAMKIVLLGGIDASLMLYDRALADKDTAAGARLGTVLAPAATGIAYEDTSGSPYLGRIAPAFRECVRRNSRLRCWRLRD